MLNAHRSWEIGAIKARITVDIWGNPEWANERYRSAGGNTH
jgi:hypothetical protein